VNLSRCKTGVWSTLWKIRYNFTFIWLEAVNFDHPRNLYDFDLSDKVDLSRNVKYNGYRFLHLICNIKWGIGAWRWFGLSVCVLRADIVKTVYINV
jgi:hypothetical protein